MAPTNPSRFPWDRVFWSRPFGAFVAEGICRAMLTGAPPPHLLGGCRPPPPCQASPHPRATANEASTSRIQITQRTHMVWSEPHPHHPGSTPETFPRPCPKRGPPAAAVEETEWKVRSAPPASPYRSPPPDAADLAATPGGRAASVRPCRRSAVPSPLFCLPRRESPTAPSVRCGVVSGAFRRV